MSENLIHEVAPEEKSHLLKSVLTSLYVIPTERPTVCITVTRVRDETLMYTCPNRNRDLKWHDRELFY